VALAWEKISGLRLDAKDFQRKTITIKQAVSECAVDGRFNILFKDTAKNKSSFRIIPYQRCHHDLAPQAQDAPGGDEEVVPETSQPRFR
jgi:hypothetical protein